MDNNNIHNDHQATCLCCSNLIIDFEFDYSEVTPGAGLSLSCIKGHFYFNGSDLALITWHKKIVEWAKKCPDFDPSIYAD